jgi:RNA polymerase sigma factor (sigma-70 family)
MAHESPDADPAGARLAEADDGELLRRYVEEDSEAAFTALVHRHFGVVYAAALRQVRDPHDARGVAQVVFASLARHASALRHRTVLIGWLYTATRYAAGKAMRAERRREAREQKALTMDKIARDPGRRPEWDQLRPVLDASLNELAEPEREAVLLRFFQGRSFAEIAAPLRLSEDGARKRVDRALERLRTSLARRGITSTPAALAAALAGQPIVAAPSGVAAAVASAALAAGKAATLSPLALIPSLLMTTSTKIVGVAALSALAAFFVGRHFGGDGAPSPVLPSTPSVQISGTLSSLEDENRRLRAEEDTLNARVSELAAKNAALAEQLAAVPAPPEPKNVTLGLADWEMKRATLNNLRQIAAARDQYVFENHHPAGAVTDLVGARGMIKVLRSVNGEDYSNLPMDPAQPLTVTMANGAEITYDTSGGKITPIDIPPEEAARAQAQAERNRAVSTRSRELQQQLQAPLQAAVAAYAAANGGAKPANPIPLLNYLTTPEDRAAMTELISLQVESMQTALQSR